MSQIEKTDFPNLGLGKLVDTVGQVLSYISLAIKETLIVGFAVIWTGFWVMVARLHLTLGEPVSAAVTSIVFILPGIGALVWRLDKRFELGIIGRVSQITSKHTT